MRTLKYTCSTQCSSLNKNSIVADFMYIQVSRNVNFTISVSHIFTRSIIIKESDLESIIMQARLIA